MWSSFHFFRFLVLTWSVYCESPPKRKGGWTTSTMPPTTWSVLCFLFIGWAHSWISNGPPGQCLRPPGHCWVFYILAGLILGPIIWVETDNSESNYHQSKDPTWLLPENPTWYNPLWYLCQGTSSLIFTRTMLATSKIPQGSFSKTQENRFVKGIWHKINIKWWVARVRLP